MHRVPLYIIFLCVLCASVVQISKAHALDYDEYPVVKLRSLDKITARTMTFEAKVGSTVRFGEIFIKVQACRKPPPVEKSEAAAFLQVWQTNEVKATSKWIFSGWMFASSPALSAMDHPVYDVWVLDCLGRDPEPLPPSETDASSSAKAPPTDGAAPNAVPPAADPSTVKPETAAQTVPQIAPEALPAETTQSGVTREDDPGAFDDDTPDAPAPATNLPADAKPATKDYAPAQETPETYKDETPADDSSPKDDTIPAPEKPAAEKPVLEKPVLEKAGPSETLEPKSEQKPESGKDFQGIY